MSIPFSLLEPGISDEEFNRRHDEWRRSMDRCWLVAGIGTAIGALGMVGLAVAHLAGLV